MSDFYQHTAITTLHQLNGSAQRLEKELQKLSRRRKIALVLPSLYSEIERPAFRKIASELNKAGYLNEIIISMNRMDEASFRKARKFFDRLDRPHSIIWNDGPRLRRLHERLQEAGLGECAAGKGFNVWTGMGYLLAGQQTDVIVTHDCDIVNYNRHFLARLAYPIASAPLSYEYCKAYYARVTDRMYGRVTRLFVTPFIRSLGKIVGEHPLLAFLDNFRYPLAGEFALSANLAGMLRIPGNWGLEIGILAEVHRNAAARRICQIELGDHFEHKHRDLARDGSPEGLMRMACDIGRTILHALASDGTTFKPGTIASLKLAYAEAARDMLHRHQDDAQVNGLVFDPRAESLAIETFLDAVDLASKAFLKDRLALPWIPSWNRVESSIPGFMDDLRHGVDADNGR